jgi:hypothetical protein
MIKVVLLFIFEADFLRRNFCYCRRNGVGCFSFRTWLYQETRTHQHHLYFAAQKATHTFRFKKLVFLKP